MSRGVASLAMYDHPAQRAANDRIWAELSRRLRARGIAAPAMLDRTRPVETIWRDPALLLAQACGYPLVSQPDLALRVVGVPVYAAPDCSDGAHVSYLVTRAGNPQDRLAEYRGGRAAINARHSNSGYNLLRATIAPLAVDGRFFGAVIETGSHRASLAALAERRADLAAIDAVTYAAVQRFEPAVTARLRVLAKTAKSPALPFVTARATPLETVAALRIALAEIIADPSLADARDALFLADIRPGGIERYAAVRAYEIDAVTAGYPVVR